MLQVREQQHHSTKVLTFTGQFGRREMPGIQVLILAAQQSGSYHIILDFSGVTEINSTSLHKLFLWYQNMKPSQVQVSMVIPPTPIWNQFDMGHISELVPIYASTEEATWNNVACS